MLVRFSFVLFAAVFAVASVPSQAAIKPPIGYAAYDSWNAIRSASFSPDGAWFAYSLTPEDGDATLVVRNVKSGKELREARGTQPVFTSDGRYVIYTIAPVKAEVDAAKKAGKKADALPKAGLGILDLSSGLATSVDRVKSRKLATNSAHWIAYLLEKPLPSKDAKPSPSPSPAASAAASPTASPTPTPDNKKKATGAKLVLRNLDSGATVEIADVTEYDISPRETYLAYATETTSGAGDGVSLRDLAAGTVSAIASGSGRYTNLGFATDADRLAFMSDASSYASAAPHPDLLLWAPSAPAARVVAHLGSAGLPRGYSPDANGDVGFTKDGALLYFGTNVAPKPQPSDTPTPMQVDLWNWRDGRLQAEQQVEADADAKQTFDAVVHVDSGKIVQLGSTALPQVDTNQNHLTALGTDPQPYYKQRSYDDFYQDSYLISLQTGRHLLAGRRVREPCSLSPAGKYALCYDVNGRDWYTVRASDGRRVVLTKGLKVAFYDELDDHPAAPPSYGSVGWTTGDARVLIHDRYDIWSFDPDRVDARDITGGYGRAHKRRFDRALTDGLPAVSETDRKAIDPNRPMYLFGLDDVTKDDGLFVLADANGGTPKRLLSEPRQYLGFFKAKDANVFALQRGSFHEYPDFWIGGPTLADLSRVTDANPQMAKYRWGTEHLFHYNANGKPLDGIVYLPDGFDPKKKYPMLVYIYERFSDDLHAFHSPAPGTSPNLLRYVSNGYVVMVPDIAYGTGHPGQDALRAVNAAIDTIVARGYVDPKHIGIAGHSWGAYEIAYMVTQTHRFAAVEAGAAVSDMASAFGGIRWGSGLVRDFQYEHGQSRMGATPWDRPDLYLASSALFHVKNVQTPYLTIANDNDDAVPWYQGIEFFTALRRLNKEAYLFVFNGEFHNLHGREQQKYWTVHLDEYFDHFLKGTPTPGWMLHGVPYLHKGERDVRPLYGEKP